MAATMCSSSARVQQQLARSASTAGQQRRSALAVLPRQQGRSRCAVVSVRAESNWSANSITRTVDTMLKRYDFVSTGLGALCVTGWFWSHGQPPLEALSIAAVSTIIALVVNELVFTGGNGKA